MVEINENLTRDVALLARLALTDKEVSTYTSQLAHILQYIEKLNEVDVATLGEPMTLPLELETVFRDDKVSTFALNPDGTSKILESAPDILDSGYKVPSIL